MVKCVKCNKLLNKKSPGLQCAECSKWIHGTCAELSTEQLSVLFDTEDAEWKCSACSGGGRPRRVSFIMPDPEEDPTDIENTLESPNVIQKITQKITKNIMYEIRKDIRETVQKELQSILQFVTDKIDEYEAKIKNYENQVSEYKNTCKNLNLKNEALEHKINVISQNIISNRVEIYGIQEQREENIMSITKVICSKLNQRQDAILDAYRKKVFKRNLTTNTPIPIVVVLSHGEEIKWLSSAKNTNLSCKDIGRSDDSKIQIRESLTPNNSFLLWKAKDTLLRNGLCKFVWYKRGSILARRTETDKPHIIRSTEDIERLESTLKTRKNTQ